MRRMIVLAAGVAALLAVCAGPAAAANFQAGQVIVKYADGVSTSQRVGLFHRAGVARTLGPVRGVDAHVVSVRDGALQDPGALRSGGRRA